MCNELATAQPAAKRGKKQSNAMTKRTSLSTVFLWTWCQHLLCTVTAQVAASNITCEVVKALPGNTVASVLLAVPASDRTLREKKVSQPDAAGAATLVMLSADARVTPAMTQQSYIACSCPAGTGQHQLWQSTLEDCLVCHYN